MAWLDYGIWQIASKDALVCHRLWPPNNSENGTMVTRRLAPLCWEFTNLRKSRHNIADSQASSNYKHRFGYANLWTWVSNKDSAWVRLQSFKFLQVATAFGAGCPQLNMTYNETIQRRTHSLSVPQTAKLENASVFPLLGTYLFALFCLVISTYLEQVPLFVACNIIILFITQVRSHSIHVLTEISDWLGHT